VGIFEHVLRRGVTQTHTTPTDDYALSSLTVAPELLDLMQYGDRGKTAIPAAYRGAQLLTDLVAQLPWDAWRGGKRSDQARRRVPELVDPRPDLLVDPSPFMDDDEVKRMIVASLIWRGNAYLWIDYVGRTFARFATPLHPDEVTVTWSNDKTARVYRWRNRDMVEGVDIIHIPFLRLPGAALGVGPFSAANAVLRGVSATDDWARRLFTDSATPSGYLSNPGKMDEDEARAQSALWDELHKGGRGTGVLSGGISYNTVSMTPEQAQFLQTRAWGVQEIARLLGIPQHFLNAGNSPGSSQSLTYTNVQAIFRELTVVTLGPSYLRRIEKAFTRLLPRGQSVAFDTSEFLRADDGARYTALKTAIEAGILTVDEARALENLPEQPTGLEVETV
jgi:HK97 family phage portal protein